MLDLTKKQVHEIVTEFFALLKSVGNGQDITEEEIDMFTAIAASDETLQYFNEVIEEVILEDHEAGMKWVQLMTVMYNCVNDFNNGEKQAARDFITIWNGYAVVLAGIVARRSKVLT